MRAFRIVLGLGVLAAFSWALVLLSVLLFGRRDEARAADAIVVLGAAQYDGRPSPVLRARLDHAIELHNRGIAPILILTGGVGPRDTVSEAAVGQRYAVRRGVPAEQILMEERGLSTDESMKSVADLMRDEGLESAVLVSDPFHMFRLRVLAWRLGFQGYSSPTRSSPIALNSREEWRHVLRESMILPVMILDPF